MKEVFICSDNIVSPLGMTSAVNFEQLTALRSGVQEHHINSMSEQPFFASLFDNTASFFNHKDRPGFTRFEQLLAASMEDALKNSAVQPADKRTLLIISTTKGNISLLEDAVNNNYERIHLQHSASVIASHFSFVNKPLIISNACISGLLAIITGMRLIRSGQYDHVVIAGADVISKFILSGFQSFQAVSKGRCTPFDSARDGINLGEAAATMVLSSDKKLSSGLKVISGSVSNDANHISGPSRTGAELSHCIQKSLNDAGMKPADIDFISAHGTATVYNDEMEAKAIKLAGLIEVPVNSLKGNYGHTLGAAGLLESVASVHALMQNTLLPTLGFKNSGISEKLNIPVAVQLLPLHSCLKTASGFGGCNASVIFSKQ